LMIIGLVAAVSLGVAIGYAIAAYNLLKM